MSEYIMRGIMLSGLSSVLARVAAGGWLVLLLCVVPAYCQDESAALMLQVSPVDGGSVNLSPGVHIFDRDSQVTLTATPKTGYQFVCWLGNVSDARAGRTSVFLDNPKIIIAVFERSKFSFVEFEEDPDISSGGGGLFRSPTEAGSNGSGIGGNRPPKFNFPRPKTPDVPVPETPPGDVPVPDDTEGDPPVPVPEPATVAFLLLGMLAMVKRPRRREKVQNPNDII